MRTVDILWISAISFIIGIVFFAYFQGWLIINFPPHKTTITEQLLNRTISKKKIKLCYWHNDAWHTEESELIWSDDMTETIQYLINNLLSLMYEEEVLNKKVSLETVMLSPNGNEAFLSFDRNPLRKEASTFEKWMIIESIIKTIRENEIPLHSVRFLVHHKLLNDYHLDFAHSWEIKEKNVNEPH